MRESNPEFTMAYMVPPAFNEDVGNQFAYSAKVLLGFVVSSQTKHLDEALAYIDWMYSDEGRELLTWGRRVTCIQKMPQATALGKNFPQRRDETGHRL